LSFCAPVNWTQHFEVDNAVDADDRAQLLHLYGGIAFDSPTAVTDGTRRQRQIKSLIRCSRR